MHIQRAYRCWPTILVCALTASAAIGAVGCVKTAGGASNTAAAGDEVSQSEADTEAFATTFVGSDSNGNVALTSFSSNDIRLRDVGADGGASSFPNLYPAGCVAIVADSSAQKNTYTFSNCSGPLGLVHLNGTVDVTWSISASTLTLDFSASDFKINGATLTSWTAVAAISASGENRSMTWTADLSGTTAGGRTFTRHNDKTISWNLAAACVSIAGTAEGTVTGDTLKTTISSYSRCADACPQAGSDIDVDNETTGENVDIRFNGNRTATITASGPEANGQLSIALACQD